MTFENEFSIFSTEWSLQVHRLQTAFTEYKIARYSYLEILSIFTNKFATSKAEEYLVNYLRVCLQLLITYSIQTENKEWTLQKEVITFENYAAKLEKVLQIPRMSVSNQFSLKNCLLRANLLKREAELICIRVSIIRWFYDLSQTIESNIKFEGYNQKDLNYVRNVASIHKRLKIKSQSCSLTSTTFNLAINFSLFSELFLLSSVSSSDQTETINEKDRKIDENGSLFWKFLKSYSSSK